MVLAKSALIMSMSLFLLDYIWKPGAFTQSGYVALLYLAFVALETATVILALTRRLKDYLGVRSGDKLPYRVLIGSVLCISSGILLILLESAVRFPQALNTPDQASTVFASMSDTSVLCGLLIMVGGVLILLRSSILGPAISIIFGLFPTPLLGIQSIPPWLPQQTTYHAFDLIRGIDQSSPYVFLIAAVVDALPILGGLLALSSVRRIRT
jgi:hypothetical protein